MGTLDRERLRAVHAGGHRQRRDHAHRRIFADFFTFRRNKGQRSWLDAHNATAVLALPFHLITYTGLITLMFMIMPWGVQSAYRDQGGEKAFFEEVFRAAPDASRRRAWRRRCRAAPLAAERGSTGKAHRWRWWWSTTGDAKAVVVTRQKTGHAFVTATGAALRGRQRTSGGGAR
jgi:hypothetical protein